MFGFFAKHNVHQEAKMLKIYSDVMFQIVVLCSQLQGVPKEQLKINKHLDEIKYQLLQLHEKYSLCSL